MAFDLNKGPLFIPLTTIKNNLVNEDPNTGDSIYYKLVCSPHGTAITASDLTEAVAGETKFIGFLPPASTGYNYYLPYCEAGNATNDNKIWIDFQTDYPGIKGTQTLVLWYLEDTSLDANAPKQYYPRYEIYPANAIPTPENRGSQSTGRYLSTPKAGDVFGIQFNNNSTVEGLGILIVGVLDTDGGDI